MQLSGLEVLGFRTATATCLGNDSLVIDSITKQHLRAVCYFRKRIPGQGEGSLGKVKDPWAKVGEALHVTKKLRTL